MNNVIRIADFQKPKVVQDWLVAEGFQGVWEGVFLIFNDGKGIRHINRTVVIRLIESELKKKVTVAELMSVVGMLEQQKQAEA